MTRKPVPHPKGIYGAPWTLTEHHIMELVNEERNMEPYKWRRHATEILEYIQERLDADQQGCPW